MYNINMCTLHVASYPTWTGIYSVATKAVHTINKLVRYVSTYLLVLACHLFSFSSYFYPLLHIPLVVDL